MDDIIDIIYDVHDVIDDVTALWQCGVCFYTMNASVRQRCKSCRTHFKQKLGYCALTAKHACLASSSVARII
jgi:ABC-type ATPase with predicted acetyltransferase domain